MAVPVYSTSPINANAHSAAVPAPPSTFAMRYTPATALEEHLAASAGTPPPLSHASSACSTPSPELMAAAQVNTQAHALNDIPASPTPLKAQPTQPTTPTRQQPPTQPSLTKLSIPQTPPTVHAQPAILSPYTPSPMSAIPSYSHSRHASSISGISAYSTHSPFISAAHHRRDLSNPPGYVQNTRETFEDRIISQDAEEQSFLVSPRSYGGRTSFGGGLLDGNYRDPVSAMEREREGDLGRLWETASEWAKLAAKKLGEGEKEVFRVLSGE